MGRTKSFARSNGAYTDPHDAPKEMFLRPLGADAKARLADPADRPEWACRATPVRYTREELRSLRDPAATERFATHLSQDELRALGAWRSAEGRWVAPSDSTICRVLADTDPDALGDVLRKWAAPRLAEAADMPALAADGKRICGANRPTPPARPAPGRPPAGRSPPG